MKDLIEAGIGILIAFIFYTILGKISPSLLLIFNFFILVVLYFAMAKGEVFSACLGTICGLIQDSFSLGIFGVSGLTLTLVGYLGGFISKKINVVPLKRTFLFLFLMASFELLLWSGLYILIFSEMVNSGKGLLFFQPLSSAFLGSLLFPFLRKIKGVKV
jgi:rod shape-determining protein MreD